MTESRSVRRYDPTDNVSPPNRTWTTNNVGEATPGILTSLGVTLFVDNVELAMRHIWADWGLHDRSEVFLPDMAADRIADTAFRGRHVVSVDTMMFYKNQLPAARFGAVDDTYGFQRAAGSEQGRAERVASLMAADEADHVQSVESVHELASQLWSRAVTAWAAGQRNAGTVGDARALVVDGDALFLRAMGRHVRSRFFLQEALAETGALVPEPQLRARLTTGAGVEELDLAAELWEVAHGRATREAFVARRGYHGTAEGTVSSYSWRERPELLDPILKRLTGAHAQSAPAVRLAETRAARQTALSTVRAQLDAARRAELEDALERVDALVRCLERGKAAYLMCVDVVRLAARALGAGYERQGQLEHAGDTFHLTVTELGGELPVDVLDLVASRRQAWEGHCRVTLPVTWVGNPEPLVAEDSTSVSNERDIGLVLHGLAASPGTVEARVCVVNDPGDVDQLADGDVIVAAATNPSWTPLFMVSGGVVVDIGTAASHAAIIARELHLPCVMNTDDAMAQLRTGDLVRVNGDAGTVELLEGAG